LTNCDLSDEQWLQASLPIKMGGLGVRKVSSVALPAYLASAASTASLQNTMFDSVRPSKDEVLGVCQNGTLFQALSYHRTLFNQAVLLGFSQHHSGQTASGRVKIQRYSEGTVSGSVRPS